MEGAAVAGVVVAEGALVDPAENVADPEGAAIGVGGVGVEVALADFEADVVVGAACRPLDMEGSAIFGCVVGEGAVLCQEGGGVDGGNGTARGVGPFHGEGVVVEEMAVEEGEGTALVGIDGTSHPRGGAAVELAVCYDEGGLLTMDGPAHTVGVVGMREDEAVEGEAAVGREE